MTATAAMGTKLKIGANSIADLTSITGLEPSADTREITTLDSPNGWRKFAQGLKDGGEASMSGYFNATDVNGQIAVYDAFKNGTEMPFEILFPSILGASWKFNGIVTGFSTGAELEDSVSFEATVKVSGEPTLVLSPSAGISSLLNSGTGGTLSPSFSRTTYFYTFNGLTGSTLTITPTAANHTLKLYVDGVFSMNLNTSLNEIPITKVGTTILVIEAVEPGKSPVTYQITVTKVS
jgi:predicted secreted protein